MSDSWDDYAEEWDTNPEVVRYAMLAFDSLRDALSSEERLSLENTRVLDFGCGTGLLSEQLSYVAKDVVALDLSSRMIDVLNQKGLDSVTTVVDELSGNLIERHPAFHQPFDLIVASSALAFVPDFPATLSLLHACLSSQGVMVQWDWLKSSEESDMGFSKGELSQAYQACGFTDVVISEPFSMTSPKGEMPVVMVVARKG